MKKILSSLLLIILTGILLLPINTKAADSDSKAGIIAVTSGNLNIRSGMSTSSAVIATVAKNKHITLISQSGSWWRVEYEKGKYGYCHADYIAPVSEKTASVKITSGSLNVRSGASLSSTKIDSLSKGEIVIILSTSGSWHRILYHGTRTGYVSSQYLSDAAYSAISLNVPDFKQTDKRWANVTIGKSGQTIAKIGCATTGVAMIESYRSGKNIYPDAMSKKLNYSSTGLLYWPSDYIAVTSASGYLNEIYKQLKSGKPVLFGAKNSYGGQHWVVITGFSGGDVLSASSFRINDPGSSTRTNLQQLLNAYPYFYKFFYYN